MSTVLRLPHPRRYVALTVPDTPDIDAVVAFHGRKPCMDIASMARI
jgi:hypothetical protein